MTKSKYLKRLRKALKGVPTVERERLIEYYSELIDDSFERGKTSRQVFSDLEDPETVAYCYFRDSGSEVYTPTEPRRRHSEPRDIPEFDEPEDEPAPRPKKKPSGGLVGLLLSIILRIVCFTIGFAFLIVAFALTVSVIVTVVALSISGVYTIVMSFPMFAKSVPLAITQLGAGALLIGASMAVELLIAPVCRLFSSFSSWLFRGFRRKEGAPRSAVKRRGFASVAVALSLIVVGGVVGTAGFGGLGFDYKRLALFDDYELKEVSVSAETVATMELVSVDCRNMSVTLVQTEEKEMSVSYYTCEDDTRSITVEDGVVTLQDDSSSDIGFVYYLKQAWNRGVAFSSLSHIYQRATLKIPADFGKALKIHVDNGAIELSGITCESAELKTYNSYVKATGCNIKTLTAETSNGAITAESLSATDVSLKSDNGYVAVRNSNCTTLAASTQNGAVTVENTTAGKAEIGTQNGAVKLNSFLGDNVRLNTQNGAIYGTMLGDVTEYAIDASAINGSCNLNSREGGSKQLTVHTSNGSIKIDFVS